MPTGAPVSLQQNFTFPARRLFPSLLVLFFSIPFCSECACSEVVHLLISNTLSPKHAQ